MKQQDKKLKNHSRIKTGPIMSLLIGLGFFTIILMVTMFVASEQLNKQNNRISGSNKVKQEEADPSPKDQSEGATLLAVVKEIDKAGQRVVLYDVNHKKDVELYYTGASNIMDKYQQQIAIGQLPIGTMVDVAYQEKNRKIKDMQISTTAWEYVGVNNMEIDRSKRIMKIASNKYKYYDDIIILDGEDFVPVTALAQQDELTVWGYDQTIWSITVTKGHGTVRLEDYEPFLGAGITIGYEAMQQITEDLVMTVREGNFNLTVESGKYSATKNITVLRNQEIVVSLSDLGPAAPKRGRVTFEINPFGADLFIDNELTFYGSPIELSYGEHKVEVSLGGYTTYKGVLVVDSAGKKVKIDLPEASSKQDIEVTESEYTPEISKPAEGDDNSDYNFEDEDLIIDEEHRIYIQNPIGASVYLNGDFMGISPCDFEKVIGTHVLTFIEEGHITQSYTIEVSNDGKDAYYTFSDLVEEEY